jgi:hypothetical protein
MALHGIVGFDVKWGSRCWAEAVQFLVDLCLVIVCFFPNSELRLLRCILQNQLFCSHRWVITLRTAF